MKILEKTYKAYLKFQVSGKKKIKIMMKAFVRMADAFFVPLLWDLGGEPYGREQKLGDHCRDWRRYHEIADCPERG